MGDDSPARNGANGGVAAPFVFDPTVFGHETPDNLIPKMDQYPVSDPAYFQQLKILDPRTELAGIAELEAALDPFAVLDESTAPQRPLQGVLLTYEQAWRQKGLALGRLLHSLCLAPGEVTKIAVIDFSRRTSGISVEGVTAEEGVTSGTQQGTAEHEVRTSVAEEAQRGTSSQSSLSSQSQAAISGGGLFVSGSASTALNMGFGVAASTSASSSQIAAQGARQMQQSTVAKSQAVRSRRATQVREVSETETQTATTRVIANYNHMHALTMMFFEVVQIFELSTRVADAERVVFLPMRPLAFTDATVRAHSRQLLAILKALASDGSKDSQARVESLENFLRTDTARLQRNVDNQATVFEVALAEAATAMEWTSPLQTSPPIEWQIETFFAESKRLLEARDARLTAMDPTLENLKALLDRARQEYEAFKGERRVLEEALRIVEFFAAYQQFFNQVLWMQMDAARYQRLVANYSFDSTPLGHLMDPRPLGVFGNYVSFRLPHATPGGDAAFAKRYVHQTGDASVPTDFLALPSGGVFGEAVLGEAIAAEKIDLTRFWNWQDSPIPILPPSMQPIDLASRARGLDFTRVDLDAALAQILEPALREGIDLDGIIGKVKEGFRDMSGSAELQALLAAQTAATQAGAQSAGEQAVQTQKNLQDFTVGLANSELAKAAVTAIAARKAGAGSATVLGGVLGGSKPAASNAAATPAEPADNPGPG